MAEWFPLGLGFLSGAVVVIFSEPQIGVLVPNAYWMTNKSLLNSRNLTANKVTRNDPNTLNSNCYKIDYREYISRHVVLNLQYERDHYTNCRR